MLVLGSLLSNIFVRDMDSGTEHILSKFGDDTRLCVVETLEERDDIQRELDRLERGAHAKLIKLNKAKRKGLLQGQGNLKHKNSLGGEWIGRSPEKN
ncbi:hypothetical protein DUI87_18865 [Hirundo rustica rustica]|uniref:Reverse transcriptase domain-containing protein n=1 Tax=Hirundo rustica rustica TaxID=333673 RepID=A0A3M0JTP9_HIRRU|nr:hypothetical protein DUI87_18865 [Hirundo rustica rustica]